MKVNKNFKQEKLTACAKDIKDVLQARVNKHVCLGAQCVAVT